MSDQDKPSFKLPILVSLALLAVMLAASAIMWVNLPADARLPVHYNIHGQADRYAGKLVAALMMPGVVMGVTLLLAVVPYIEPRRQHLRQSAKAYAALWIAVVGLFATLHVNSMLIALGHGVNLTTLVGVLLGLLFMVLGNYLGKVRSTFMFGIRTPWTLSSDQVWDKTHRLGGRMFFTVGLASVVLAVLGLKAWAVAVLAGGAIGSAILLTIYSYVLWRREEHRSGTGS